MYVCRNLQQLGDGRQGVVDLLEVVRRRAAGLIRIRTSKY